MYDAVTMHRHHESRQTSTVLRSFLVETQGEEIALSEVIRTLGGRGFGILLFVFSMLALVPALVPGLSTIFGLPLLFLSWQLAWGYATPWFPASLARRRIARAQLERLTGAAERFRPFERLFRPRLSGLVSDTAQRLIGVACLVLSTLIVLPIWMGNWLPAVAIGFLGLAIAKRDGAATILGLTVGAAALATVVAVVFLATATVRHIV